MNPIVANTLAVCEDGSHYWIRYRVEKDRFSQVLSSVTSHSILLLGVEWNETPEPSGSEPPGSLIAMIPLTASIDPNQTTATFEDNELVLQLVKSEGRLDLPFVHDTTMKRMIQNEKTEYDYTGRSDK